MTTVVTVAFLSLHLCQPAASGPTPDQLAREVEALVRQLGSDSFPARQQAQQKLLRIGAPAVPRLEAASQGGDAETARRAAAVLEALRQQLADRAEVHVVGLYECCAPRAVVELRPTGRPVTLVLCAYESVAWEVRPAAGVEVVRVIASGYHRQTVAGVTAPVVTFSHDEGSLDANGRSFYFYTFDHDEERYPDMVAKVRQLTGRRVASFQGRYSYKQAPFVVGGAE